MPRQKSSDQIETLRRQQAEIAARLKDATAKARVKKREDDERRERLVGRYVLARLEQDPGSTWSTATLALLDQTIKRSADRALLPALPSATNQAEAAQTA